MDTEKQALLSVIDSKFSYEKLTMEVLGDSFDYIRVADEEEVLSLITDQSGDDPQYQPYWALTWESTIGLCRRLAREDLSQKTVLDIGCGLGMVGTFAASRGAEVVMGDAVPSAMLFAEFNSWEFRDRVETRVLDWRNDDLQRQFDFVVGADILYQESDWSHLDRFWQKHLKPAGSVIIAEPNRLSGREFTDWLAKQTAWQMSEEVLKVKPRTIRIFDIRP